MNIHVQPDEPTLDELGAEFADDHGTEIDRFVTQKYRPEFGGWPGIAETQKQGELRLVTATHLIAPHSEVAADWLVQYRKVANAKERRAGCPYERAQDIRDALTDLRTLNEDLIQHFWPEDEQ